MEPIKITYEGELGNKSTEVLLHAIIQFYERQHTNDLFFKVVDLIEGKSKCSLRLIDWFVTNYSKKHNTVIDLNSSYFNVYLDYRAQLKAFSKRMFDPFRRANRIHVEYTLHDSKTRVIYTTVGQLAFFRWAFENNIIHYIESNFDKIKNDMDLRANTTSNANANANANEDVVSMSIRKKRNELSDCKVKKMTQYSGKTVLTFC